MLRCLQQTFSRQCGRKVELVHFIRSNGELKMKSGPRPNAKLEGSRGLPYWNTGNGILNGKP